MVYKFKDIYNDKMYESARVIFAVSKYAIFNNYIADKMKEMCRTVDIATSTEEISNEFGLGNSGESSENVVDLDTFFGVSSAPNVNGLWYCSVDLATVNKKNKKKLEAYIKKPSEYGILVITSDDWKEYKYYINSRTIKSSSVTHLIQLGFPTRTETEKFVAEKFSENGVEVDVKAVEYFIMKMSNAYDEYNTVIESLCSRIKVKKIDIVKMKDLMKGIEHFDLNNFIIEITKPLSSNKTNSKKVYRMMVALIDEYGARNLALNILREVDKIIDFRIMINSGIIPIQINYFYSDVIDKIGKDNKYAKMQEWKFRSTAMLAAQTSLRDWEYIKMMLAGAVNQRGKNSEYICERALYDVVNRSVLSSNRIDNIIGIDNILEDRVTELGKFKYIDNIKEDG